MMSFAAFVGTAVIALPPGAAAPETLRFDVLLGETRIGQSLMLRVSESADSVMRQTEILDVVLSRGGERISLGQRATTREDARGRLLSYEVESEGMGPRPWRDRLRRIPEGWERTRDRGEGPRTDTLPPAELWGPAGIERNLIASGDSIAFESVDEGTLQPHAYLARPIPQTAATPRNLPPGARGFELLDRKTGQRLREWLDGGGRLLAAEDPALGWRIERSGPALPAARGAGSKAQTAGDLDLFEWRTIPFSGVPPASGACELLVRFPEAGAPGAPGTDVAIPEGPGQTVRRGDGPGFLRVRIDPPRAPSTSEESRAAWRSDEALAGSLRPGVTVDADHAAVRAFAAAVCEGAGSPTEDALRLEKAVRDRIEEDDLKTVFATASQTLASRSGDCTEHAVLLTACLRARGIPARLVAGLVPIGSTMLYHLWSEAYLGTWVALDATIGNSRSHPCALALARWDQPEEGLAEFQIAMARLGGTVRIEVASPR